MNVTDFSRPPFAVPLASLPDLLPGSTAKPPAASAKPLAAWNTKRDESEIFSYLYRSFRPQRHLEFGTWQGFGTCLCLEACEATVWTLNLPDGESTPAGTWAYGERVTDEVKTPPGAVRANYGEDEAGPRTYHRTDAASYIGRLYREKGLGRRVCQIYCDSRQWDTAAYPAGFFNSVLIDGGHQRDVVISDTQKALPLLAPGGLMLWHDFCPRPDVIAQLTAVRGVTDAIGALLPKLMTEFSKLVWIEPSYILLGIKK